MRGQFGRGHSQTRDPRANLPRFRPKEREGPIWKSTAPLWLGAIFLGTAYWSGFFTVGLPDHAPAGAPTSQASRQASAPIADAADRSWEQRAASADAPAIEQTPERIAEGQPVTFYRCHTGGGTNCVVDGDTLWIGGQNVRIANIDAPETHEPQCERELELGARATDRLHQLVNSGTVTLEYVDRDRDRYGRSLRKVRVDGTDVGKTLVGEGLARWYIMGRKSWCG